MKRVRIEVCPQNVRNKAHPWKVTQDGQTLFEHGTQAEAIAAARILVDTLVMQGRTATLKIKRPDGTIRDERTYPRSSDPRRSKG